MKNTKYSRRKFLRNGAVGGLGAALVSGVPNYLDIKNTKGDIKNNTTKLKDPVIDIHQHIFYHGRTDAQLLAHQKAMGVTTTIMLPAGSPENTMSTHF